MKHYMGWRIDFTRPAGEPGYAMPGSTAWRVFANPVAMALGGVCAVLLEFADPRIRTGVWEHSNFSTDPLGRARRTGMAAHIGVFAPRSAAQQVIAAITRMHVHVAGETPDGRPYRALDPELLDWVAATASYGFVMAYHRFVEPLPAAEMDRFFAEAVPIGTLYGAQNLPRSLVEFERMCEHRLPAFEPHPIVLEFLTIIRSGATVPGVPHRVRRDVARGAVSILPPGIRAVLGLGGEFELSPGGARALRLAGRLAAAIPQPLSPAAQASARLGLPRSFPWRSRAAQARLLASRRPQGGNRVA